MLRNQESSGFGKRVPRPQHRSLRGVGRVLFIDLDVGCTCVCVTGGN